MSIVLTTPLYYVNDKPHLGSTYTTIACDALARFYRQKGMDVIFITGVDEHGLKIQRTAEQTNKTPIEHCDSVSKQYQELWELYRISHDSFVRTTSKKHKHIVEDFFKRVQSSGDIRLGRQTGWYCVSCEEYKDDVDSNEQPICTIHKKPLEWRDEENLFFCLSRYQHQIEELVHQPGFIVPQSRRNEVQNFVKKGLRDFSISRVDLSWGIEVPGFPGHTFYVWFDALVGYLTGSVDNLDQIGSESTISKYWPPDTQIIGKDILRFHAIFWPAMLISAGLPVPQSVFGHGFLTREGLKMGKTIGNIIDPIQLVEDFGRDAVRWYLLRDFQFGNDGDFQQQRFIDTVNNDLSNTIGNLLNRTSTMARKWFNNEVPPITRQAISRSPLKILAQASIDTFVQSMTCLKFQEASLAILDLASGANMYLNDTQPWTMIKDINNNSKVAIDLYVVLEATRIVGILLHPLVPDISSRVLEQLNYNQDDISFNHSLDWGLLKSGQPLPKPVPVFQRIDTSLTS